MNVTPKRKGLAVVKRLVTHKEFLVGEVCHDPTGEYEGQETLCFLNKSKQLWMLDELDVGDHIGIELPLKPGRGIDPVTWALPNHDQPEALKKLVPTINETAKSIPLQQSLAVCKAVEKEETSDFDTTDLVGCKKISGRLRDPQTQKAFEQLMIERQVNQTEAVEIAVRHGLLKLGFRA